MTRRLPTALHPRTLVAALLLVLAACLAPGAAHAACTRGVTQQLDRAAAVGTALTQQGAPGAADATAVIARARTRCVAAGFAAAVVSTTRYYGLPAIGQRRASGAFALIGTQTAAGPAWRLDVARQAARATKRPKTVAARRARTALGSAAFGVTSTTWSNDPTQLVFDAGVQSAVARSLAASPLAADRAAAGRSVRVFAKLGYRRALLGQPLPNHLTVAVRLATSAAASRDPRARRAAGSVATGAYARLRGAAAPAWGRIDGRWATGAEQRQLVSAGVALLKHYPSAPTAVAVTRLKRQLVTRPTLAQRSVPVAAFYPWPRDGAFDSQSVQAFVSKPGTLALDVYGADGAVIHHAVVPVEPGVVTVGWDGSHTGGSIVGAGEYRYQLVAVDPAGNRQVLPGLKSFRVARDTTPPVVKAATVKYLNNGALGPRVVVTWQVEEPLSPNVRTFLVLVNGAQRQSILLDEHAQTRAMRKAVSLPKGTWSATLVFLDGSGNRAARGAGQVVVR